MFGFLFRGKRLLEATQQFLANDHDVHFGPNGLARLQATCEHLAPHRASKADAGLAILTEMVTDPEAFGLSHEATGRLVKIMERLVADTDLASVRENATAAIARVNQRRHGLSEWTS